MLELEKPVQTIKGIGPKTSEMMNRIDIFSIKDLLMHFPRKYEDWNFTKPVSSLSDGDETAVRGRVYLIDNSKYTSGGKHITRVLLKNDTGFISGVWFNQKYIGKNFKPGEEYIFYGRVSCIYGDKQIINPEYEKVCRDMKNRIVPVYSLTKNLSQKLIRNAILNILNSDENIMDEIMPSDILKRYGLTGINQALSNIHFPGSFHELNEAQKRLKFDELLILQLGLMMERNKIEGYKGISFKISKELKNFISALPFQLTNAQKRVVNEILNDMKSDKQMNRLIQGDVGSGKTVVAQIALFNAVKNGYQAAFMAPTEILAMQHFESLVSLFAGYDICIKLLSGSQSKNKKDEIKYELKAGKIDIIVGTHALIENDVEFRNLGLVITDEQHRFGVRQRALLNQKGDKPDILVMTATPIPRTMALFIYGDLDVSIIDELPPGRKKVETYVVSPAMRRRIYNFVKSEVQKGRQAYVVCPIIDDSDTLDIESAINTAEKLKKDYLKGIRIGLVHGRLKSEDKDDMLLKFKNGEIDVLVSTTVIEVGIDVPNASVIVVESADRFGLSELHQLRGRVGRGKYKSYCILIADMENEISKERMKIISKTSDGFKISEKDLRLRGTGEFFGVRQHGLPELKIANLFEDINILRETNKLARELVKSGRIYYDEEYSMLRNITGNKFKICDNSITL